ncbi:MAG: hypothetical protein HY052_03530 [Proteobacteria bacterium]|nr:hypothetical protein [Pseudomonadota bacterium]
MTKKYLPELKVYSIEQFAKKLGCTTRDILHYGRTGQLKLSVLSKGWTLECGYYEEADNDGGLNCIPCGNVHCSPGTVLGLWQCGAIELAGDGSAVNPSFYFKDYSYAVLPEDGRKKDVIVKEQDVVITIKDALDFEASASDQALSGSDSENTASDGYLSTPYTGDPGRPSKAAHLYLKKFKDLCKEGQVAATLAEQSRHLLQWLETEHPSIPHPTVRVIENRIRSLYNKARTAS